MVSGDFYPSTQIGSSPDGVIICKGEFSSRSASLHKRVGNTSTDTLRYGEWGYPSGSKTYHPSIVKGDVNGSWNAFLYSPPTIHYQTTTFHGNEGDGSFPITVTLDGPWTLTTTVTYDVSEGTATADQDFMLVSGTLTFPPGVTTVIYTIPLVENTLDEIPETILLSLEESPEQLIVGSPSTSTAIIHDNDDVAISTTIIAPPDPATPVSATVDTEIGTGFITLTEALSDGVLSTTVSTVDLTDPPTPYKWLPIYVTIETNGFHFAQAELRLPYREAEVTDMDLPESSLRLLEYTTTGWNDQTTLLNTSDNVITGNSESLGTFVVATMPIPNCAVTINNGATHSDIRTVRLFSDIENASEVLVSNDAGFPGAAWQSYTTNLTWVLTDPSSQVSTLLSYLRVRDARGRHYVVV